MLGAPVQYFRFLGNHKTIRQLQNRGVRERLAEADAQLMTVVLVVCFPVLVVPHAERVPGAELQVRSLTDGKIDSGADLDTPALLGGSLGRGRVVVVVKPS